jgi:hypothetical protein
MLGNIFHRNTVTAQKQFMTGGGMALNRGVTPAVAPRPAASVGDPRRKLLGRGTA